MGRPSPHSRAMVFLPVSDVSSRRRLATLLPGPTVRVVLVPERQPLAGESGAPSQAAEAPIRPPAGAPRARSATRPPLPSRRGHAGRFGAHAASEGSTPPPSGASQDSRRSAAPPSWQRGRPEAHRRRQNTPRSGPPPPRRNIASAGTHEAGVATGCDSDVSGRLRSCLACMERRSPRFVLTGERSVTDPRHQRTPHRGGRGPTSAPQSTSSP